MTQDLFSSHSNRGAAVLSFLGITLIFALAYTQSPLYTSNQNQYFLHGLARVGYGSLHLDWLANTLDPTPVFTTLVELTYRLFHLPEIHYLYYAFIMGIYAWSLIGIVETVYPVRRSNTIFLVFFALLIVAHSAGLRLALSRLLGTNWAYVLEDGLADQRLLGPVLQPSAFGAFLLLSIYLFLRGHAGWAVLSAALAATVHPTYLLSAAALTLSYMLITFMADRRLPRPAMLGAVALVAVLPILIYTYTSFAAPSPESSEQARHILVDYRIPHHALIDWWFDATAVVKIALVAVALLLIRRTQLLIIMLVCSLIAASLSLVQWLTQSDFLALIFPWRLSTFLVPLATALILGFAVTTVFMRFPDWMRRYEKIIRALCMAAILLALLAGGLRLWLDFARQQASEDRPVMAYLAAQGDPTAVYLIPVKMQDFRLAAQAPAYVDFKAIPYRAADVLEWRHRIELAEHFYKQKECAVLDEIAAQGGVTHVVLPAENFGMTCPQLTSLYRDDYYEVSRYESP
ncbi:MAG: hypothetical protein JXB15_14895 [Anaerolineales bacterium]|nr:hypothetical protein [Anaerolineales bacterium]